jgi:hypothetical protein
VEQKGSQLSLQWLYKPKSDQFAVRDKQQLFYSTRAGHEGNSLFKFSSGQHVKAMERRAPWEAIGIGKHAS